MKEDIIFVIISFLKLNEYIKKNNLDSKLKRQNKKKMTRSIKNNRFLMTVIFIDKPIYEKVRIR